MRRESENNEAKTRSQSQRVLSPCAVVRASSDSLWVQTGKRADTLKMRGHPDLNLGNWKHLGVFRGYQELFLLVHALVLLFKVPLFTDDVQRFSEAGESHRRYL